MKWGHGTVKVSLLNGAPPSLWCTLSSYFIIYLGCGYVRSNTYIDAITY